VQRIDAVLRSRHRHELADHVADLPSPVPRTSARPFLSARQRVGFLPVAAAVVLAAVLVQAFAGLWELWPLAVVAVGASTLLVRR
jgi:fatty acid desaturase